MAIKAKANVTTPTGVVEPPAVEASFGLALAATLIACLIVNVVFVSYSQAFDGWRQTRTEFAFTPPVAGFVQPAIWFFTGFVLVQARQWIVPVCVGLLLTYLLIGGHAWSGPGYMLKAVQPLIEFRWEMQFLGFAITMGLLITSTQVERRCFLKG